uniref:Uncharacterized protein n=1 Tax=Trypanosoma vivax (strain Y486) TaxID=1055687 RepID=G0U6K3_TRYVY
MCLSGCLTTPLIGIFMTGIFPYIFFCVFSQLQVFFCVAEGVVQRLMVGHAANTLRELCLFLAHTPFCLLTTEVPTSECTSGLSINTQYPLPDPFAPLFALVILGFSFVTVQALFTAQFAFWFPRSTSLNLFHPLPPTTLPHIELPRKG